MAKGATLAGAFAGVANVDPSRKAEMLSQSIAAGMTIGSIGAPAIAAPIVFAILLFLRARRTPLASLDPAGAVQRQQVRR